MSLHDTFELFRIGDVRDPSWELRVPDEGVTSDDGSSLGRLVKDL